MSSKTIYIYLKIHRKAKVFYLGRTSYDPYTYRGSGKTWKRLLKKHGNDVKTIVLRQFDESDPGLYLFCRWLSDKWNIVNSNRFANLMEETGEARYVSHTADTRKKIGEASKGRILTPEQNKSKGRPGRKQSPEHIAKRTRNTKTMNLGKHWAHNDDLAKCTLLYPNEIVGSWKRGRKTYK